MPVDRDLRRLQQQSIRLARAQEKRLRRQPYVRLHESHPDFDPLDDAPEWWARWAGHAVWIVIVCTGLIAANWVGHLWDINQSLDDLSTALGFR